MTDPFETLTDGESKMSTPTAPTPNEGRSNGISDVKLFANSAMQAIIQRQDSVPDTEAEREEIALWSWRMAQTMVLMEKRLHADDA